ncbi:N-acetyl sugar amidotransferase [Endozoicomonas acroporae]|uniref:N-acetyl sugar amidotransferase n=1 Tax=Endozoicomonas acroporae TaxID=1701104 RepID=UPI003D7B0A91
MTSKYQICSRCVMDTTDPEINFNEKGVCNHCLQFEITAKNSWFPGPEGKQYLTSLISKIKSDGQNQEYDCILGLSGGVDSAYLALKLKDWGLKPLVVHVDAGWNSELAVANIETLVKYCNYDLHTHVVDWEDMRDLHLSYLQAGVANQDVPQDHIFFASLYHFATQNNIRYVISGGNLATEGIFPSAWHGSAMDAINLKAIHQRFGKRKLSNYKTISFFECYIWFPLIKRMRTVRPLNYMHYHKAEALQELQDTVGYKPYARKHGESLFTKLFQNYYLPEKFGYDKRRPHLSSLIVSGQMTRKEALEKMDEPLYDKDELEIDIAYFCKKLRISREQFDQYIKNPNHHYDEYPNWNKNYQRLKGLQSLVTRITGKKLKVYS